MPNDPYKIIPGKPLNTPEFKKAQEIIDSADAGVRATNFVNAVDQIKKFEADKVKLDQTIGNGITDILATKAAMDIAPKEPGFFEYVAAGYEMDANPFKGVPEALRRSKKD